MATWKSENSMLTAVGVEILNKLKIGGEKLTITRIVAGSGRVTNSKLYQQTSISGTQRDMTISSTNTNGNSSEISFFIDNEGQEGYYDLHQIGVYVTHPDYAGEQLYFITQCEETDFDSIPPVAITPVKMMYSLILEHGNSSSLEFVIDPLGVVTHKDFDEFKEQYDSDKKVIQESVNTVSQNLDNFSSGVKPQKLVTADASGNLIASGKNTVSGAPILVKDALEHRALSLSIEGKSTQAGTPTPSAPVYLVNSEVEYIRNYNGSKAELISFPSIIVLRSLGDYKDTIEWDGAKWWKVQRIQEVVLDGTTNGVYYAEGNSGAAYCRFCITSGTLYKIIKDHITSAPIITSHGNATHPKDTAEFYAFHYTTSKAICGHFLNTLTGVNYSSQTPAERGATVNAWLKAQKDAGTPVKVYYVLQTPIVTEISLTKVLEMYPSHTEMSCYTNGNAVNMVLSYAINTTDETTKYILKSLARKAEVTTANTFAVATLIE